MQANTADLGQCLTPTAEWVELNSDVDSQRVAARAWMNAVAEHELALMSCASALYADETTMAMVDMPEHSLFSCDYDRCAATLAEPFELSQGGAAAPSKPAEFLARAADLSDLAAALYAEQRYAEARQEACCAERVLDEMLERAGDPCDTEHCLMTHIYPGASSIDEYADQLALDAGSRKRALALDRDHGSQHGTRTVAAPAPASGMVLFEECDEPDANFQPDHDFNDAVFSVRVEVARNMRQQWSGASVHVHPLARGSTRDATLSFSLVDANVPRGARVRVVHYGREPAVDCFTANAPELETEECPSVTSVRLIRSLRAALPSAPGSQSGMANVIASEPLAMAEHRAALFIEMPAGIPAPLNVDFKLALELRARVGGAGCAARLLRDDLSSEARGFGVLVPQPFYYASENVPMFFNETRVARAQGLCVEGDNARAICDAKDECPGGYCELDGPNAHRCVDASGVRGVDSRSFCKYASQCPYGHCYGNAPTQQGAYPALADFIASGRTQSQTWFLRDGAVDQDLLFDPSAHDK